MKYYIFKEACATKETGSVYPQIQKWKPGYDDDRPNSYYSYYVAAKNGKFPSFEPDLDSLLLHGNAKPTDLISSVISIGFIVSKKLKSLFQEFNFPSYRFYPATVLHKKAELNNYHLMHIISDYTDYVDYSKSDFITCGFSDDDVRPIALISKQDYINKAKQLQDNSYIKKLPYRSIKVKEIYLNSKFDKSLDFFEIGRFDINYYISERLKIALIENNITGCDIQPSNNIFF